VKNQKHRKRKGGASSSQPPMIVRGREDLVPPRPDGIAHRLHEAGKPILPPEMLCMAYGHMHVLHQSILHLEGLLLKDKHPNYPVFIVQVPMDDEFDFVREAPADVFFIAYEDVFNLFHQNRLNYNLVRLYALNEARRIYRDNLQLVAVADPYYMRDSQLVEGSRTQTMATEYLERFMLENKRKNSLLLPFFPE
jgi:hypothetical protein